MYLYAYGMIINEIVNKTNYQQFIYYVYILLFCWQLLQEQIQGLSFPLIYIYIYIYIYVCVCVCVVLDFYLKPKTKLYILLNMIKIIDYGHS